MKSFLRGLVFISGTMLLISFLYAAVSHRPLLGEGSNWYLHIFNYRTHYFDATFYRLTDILLQYPTLILLKYTDLNQLGVYLLSFSYIMHPIFSLIWCYFILRKNSRLDLLIFPIFSLVAATMPALPMAIGLSSDVLSIFWPLFFITLFAKSNAPTENTVIVLLLVALTFSYEPALLMFGVLIIAALCRRKYKQDYSWLNLFVVVFSILSIAFLAWVIYSTAKHVLNNHFIYMYQNIGTFRLFGFLSIMLLTALLLFRKESKILYAIYLVYGLSIFSWFFYKYSDFDIDRNLFSGIGPTTAFAARATAVPVGAFLGFITVVYFFRSTVSENWLSSKYKNGILIFASSVCLAGVLCDVRTTYLWRNGFSHVENFVNKSEGCVEMDVDEFFNYPFKSSIPDYSIAAMSIVIQLANGEKEISKLVFTDNYRPNTTGRKACEHFDGEKIVNNQSAEVRLINTSLKFSDKLMKQIQR